MKDKTPPTNNFIQIIERLVAERGFTYIDAVLFFCKEHNVEVETAASLIKMSTKMKMKLKLEAQAHRMMK